MKLVLKIVFVIVAGLIIYGFYINSANEGQGEKFIGFGVLVFAFILMPLFIYHRYKDKDLSKYRFLNKNEKNEKKN
ncbi:MAG: hypothetical protein ABFR32_03950 [Bacteroidota bacterium]